MMSIFSHGVMMMMIGLMGWVKCEPASTGGVPVSQCAPAALPRPGDNDYNKVKSS